MMNLHHYQLVSGWQVEADSKEVKPPKSVDFLCMLILQKSFTTLHQSLQSLLLKCLKQHLYFHNWHVVAGRRN